MSEFSMMTKDFDVGWPAAYGGFLIGSAVIGWATCHLLKAFEARQVVQAVSEKIWTPQARTRHCDRGMSRSWR